MGNFLGHVETGMRAFECLGFLIPLKNYFEYLKRKESECEKESALDKTDGPPGAECMTQTVKKTGMHPLTRLIFKNKQRYAILLSP